MKILVFDTETTGLPERNALITDLNKWPHVMQLSYIYFDISQNRVIRKVDDLIKIADDIEISEKSIEIHGISREKSVARGINIKEALREFNGYLKSADVIVGHNIEFDKKVLMVEFGRNKIFHNFYIDRVKKPEYCTMKNSINLCKLTYPPKIDMTDIIVDPNRAIRYKYPKLIELYSHLFNYTPNNLHDAMVDVLICLRCYCTMEHRYDIFNNSKEIVELFMNYGV